MSRYDGPIVDAHHHFWEPALGRQPWLRPGARIPFRYGEYESIKKSYLPPDLLRDARDFNLVGTVTMETEWEESDQAGEMDYMQRMQDRYGLPNACVAHAVLDDRDVEGLLEYYSTLPIVRSVRHKPGQANNPAEAREHPSKLMDEQWRRGYSLLAKYGLQFDLQVAWWHLSEAVDLAHTFPDQLIIVNHSALPADRSSEMMEGWTKAVRGIATCPNVMMKISGIGLKGVPWTVKNNRVIVETLFDAFGSDRVMFASNFPVDSLCGSYSEILGGFLEMSENWSRSEQRDAFIATAVRAYGLDQSLLNASHAPIQAYDSEMRAELTLRQ